MLTEKDRNLPREKKSILSYVRTEAKFMGYSSGYQQFYQLPFPSKLFQLLSQKIKVLKITICKLQAQTNIKKIQKQQKSRNIFRYNINRMKNDSKYGLRNASNILNKIKSKYLKTASQQTQLLQQNKTFADQDSIELDQPKNIQMHAKTSGEKEERSLHKDVAVEEFSEIKKVQKLEKEQPSFCDRIVLKKLEETLKIYQQDLEILTQNRDFLVQQIEMIAQKIKKLSELQQNNKKLSSDNQNSKRRLQQLMKESNAAEHNLFKCQIKHQQIFNAFRSKVRMALKETGEDYQYIGFVEQWNRHVEQGIIDRKALRSIVDKNQGKTEKKEEKVEKVPVITDIKQSFVPGEEEYYLAPDQPKPKKKLTASQKAALLGDLKSFSKNFKLPPNG